MNLIRLLKQKNRLDLVLAIGLSCLFSLVLSAYRMYHTHSLAYIFFWWNLFLAIIPFAISTWLFAKHDQKKIPGIFWWIYIGTWLLFFPNSPYILTDLLHLRERTGMPFWYDILMSVSFVWNGIMLGLLSLSDIQQIISRRYNATFAWLFAAFSICLGSFGIYLGRFERWNSWDVVTNPFSLMLDILNQVIHPFAHQRTVAVTILFSAFLSVAYLMIRLMMKLKPELAREE